MTLASALKTLDRANANLLLSDGATTWDIPNLLDAVGGDAAREVAIVDANGKTTIQAVDDAGFVATGEPLYREVEAA